VEEKLLGGDIVRDDDKVMLDEGLGLPDVLGTEMTVGKVDSLEVDAAVEVVEEERDALAEREILLEADRVSDFEAVGLSEKVLEELDEGDIERLGPGDCEGVPGWILMDVGP
jgi:hypothetical protein